MKYFVILLVLIGFVGTAFAIPEFTESEKAYGADAVIIGQILSYYDEGEYRFYEVSVMNKLSGEVQKETITMRSINESGFDPIDPYNVFEESDLVLLYLKDYGRGFWESTNFSKTIPEGQLQNTIDRMKVTVDISSLPPLKQYKTGVSFNEIQCKQNLLLIQKYDGTPACVTESTKQKLTERGWTGKETLEPTTYADCKKKAMPSEFTQKKNTWISIAQLPSDKVKGDCTIITDDVLSQYDFLKNAIDGANDCKDDLIYCGGGRVTLERVYNFGVSISDSLDYELSLSKQQVESLLQRVTLTPTEDLAYGTIKHNDKHYQIILHTTNSNTTSHVKGKFASISEKPVPLQRRGSVDFTYSVESFATFGSDARIKLTTTNPARDSDLKINVVPPVLEIPERTQENATITVYAGKDAKDGIYQIRVSGRNADSGGLIRTDHLPSYPKVNVGNSSWEIFTYGNDRGSGFSGANPPPKWAWAELELNQDTFYDGDMMEIKAYLVNNGTKTLVLDEAKLLIQVIKATSDGYYSNLYGIDAELVDGETITVDPKSRELIARPFFWDQMTFNQNDESYRVDPAERKILMTLGHYNGTVWRDEISFVMK